MDEDVEGLVRIAGDEVAAVLANATNRPSADSAGVRLEPAAWVPSEATLTRTVSPVLRSWTNTSEAPFESPATRLLARLAKATSRPSAEIDDTVLLAFAWPPAEATLTRSVAAAAVVAAVSIASALTSAEAMSGPCTSDAAARGAAGD